VSVRPPTPHIGTRHVPARTVGAGNGAMGGGKTIPAPDQIRPYFGKGTTIPQIYVQYLALIGMPATAAALTRRYGVHFNPKTLRRWRAAGGPIATFALLVLSGGRP
jgi:hypothetical protein